MGLLTVSGGGGSSDVVDDTTPQLGGNLDLNSNDITGTGNVNITGGVTASGNGNLGGLLFRFNRFAEHRCGSGNQPYWHWYPLDYWHFNRWRQRYLQCRTSTQVGCSS